ncbi:MAG TPA: hypothetical protein VNQ73_14380 [Ilumatobacter sp.]|nr:hypothetical protein [Ilumatobacter sp.]
MHFDPTLTTSTAANKAREVREEADRKVDDVRANNDLTAEAKTRLVNEIRQTANARVAELEQEHRAADRAERERLEQRLFTPPTAYTGSERITQAISYRDALDRARATSIDVPMSDLMRDAWRVGDDLLAKAALSVAFDRRDVDSLNTWIDRHPADDTDLNRLVELAWPRNPTQDMVNVLAEGFAFQR